MDFNMRESFTNFSLEMSLQNEFQMLQEIVGDDDDDYHYNYDQDIESSPFNNNNNNKITEEKP